MDYRQELKDRKKDCDQDRHIDHYLSGRQEISTWTKFGKIRKDTDQPQK